MIRRARLSYFTKMCERGKSIKSKQNTRGKKRHKVIKNVKRRVITLKKVSYFKT